MFETSKCPSCESPQIATLCEYRFSFPGEDIQNHMVDPVYERLWILFDCILKTREPARFRSMLCDHCGLIFTNPRFTAEDLRVKYDMINKLGSVKERNRVRPPSNLGTRSDRIYRLIRDHLRPVGPGENKPRILDYGGASGYNLAPFTTDFECGILDYERWQLPPGIKYLGADLADLAASQQFDVILLLHTLEHVPSPSAFLSGISKHLRDGGILYVEVPLGCFREWSSLSEPLTHVNFFSEQSLLECFRQSGLALIQVSSSYQWVTHGNMWCLNMIGMRSISGGGQRPIRSVLTTRQQMKRQRYYVRLLTDPEKLGRRLRRFISKPSPN